jgi:hypothetical protein
MKSDYPLSRIHAYIVESSDDGGESWEIHDIEWTVEACTRKAREIPWAFRIRKVRLTDTGELVGRETIKEALALNDVFDKFLP